MELSLALKKHSNQEKAKLLQRFFKTGKGEYGEGDVFLGLAVPATREIIKSHINLPFDELQLSLNSKFHEERLAALLILVHQFKKADENKRKEIFNFYLKNAMQINNWDLVDLSAPNIIGEFLKDKSKSVLYELVKSENIWERRISILATFTFIKNNNFQDSLKLATILLKDKHNLIHKAVGWMLREMGKKDISVLENFLKLNYKQMPRTMLRYAIEKIPEARRKAYLNGEI